MTMSSGSGWAAPVGSNEPLDDNEKTQEFYTSEMDKVYRERNRMVAQLAAEYPSDFVPGADQQWPDFAIVYVKLPTGQASWHIPPRDFDLFNFMPRGVPEEVRWDGHSTEEKNSRIETYTRMVYTARMATDQVGSLGEGYLLQKLPDMEKIALVCLAEHEGNYDRILWVGEDVNSTSLRDVMNTHANMHHGVDISGEFTQEIYPEMREQIQEAIKELPEGTIQGEGYFPPSAYGEPLVEIDEDFYILGAKLYCRLKHKNQDDALLGEVAPDMTDEQIQAVCSEHDREKHDGP